VPSANERSRTYGCGQDPAVHGDQVPHISPDVRGTPRGESSHYIPLAFGAGMGPKGAEILASREEIHVLQGRKGGDE